MEVGEHSVRRIISSPESPPVPPEPPLPAEQQLFEHSRSSRASGFEKTATRSEAAALGDSSGTTAAAGERRQQEESARRAGGRVRYCARCRTHGDWVRLESGTHHPLVCPHRSCTCRHCARLDRRSQRQQSARATERMRRFTELQQMIRSGGGPDEPEFDLPEQPHVPADVSAALEASAGCERTHSPTSDYSKGAHSPGAISTTTSKPIPNGPFPFKSISTALTRKYSLADNVSHWGFPRVNRRAPQPSPLPEASDSESELERASRRSSGCDSEEVEASGIAYATWQRTGLPSPPPLQPIDALDVKREPEPFLPNCQPLSPARGRAPDAGPEAEPRVRNGPPEPAGPTPELVSVPIAQLQQLQMLGMMGMLAVQATSAALPNTGADTNPHSSSSAAAAAGNGLAACQQLPAVPRSRSSPSSSSSHWRSRRRAAALRLAVSPEAAALGVGLEPLVEASLRSALQAQASLPALDRRAPQPASCSPAARTRGAQNSRRTRTVLPGAGHSASRASTAHTAPARAVEVGGALTMQTASRGELQQRGHCANLNSSCEASAASAAATRREEQRAHALRFRSPTDRDGDGGG